MDRLQLKDLADNELELSLMTLCQKERVVTVELLYHLIELDNRRLYLKAGYSSLFDYCRRRLLYSEGAAQRRILAARCLADTPELESMLRDGRANLCTIAAAASSLRAKTAALADIAGKSKKEVEMLVALASPRPKPKEVIRPLVAIATPERPPKIAQGSLGLAACKDGETRERLLKPVPPSELGSSVTPAGSITVAAATSSHAGAAQERFELKFSVSRETYEKFKIVRSKLSNVLGADLSLEAVFTKLLEFQLREPRQRKHLNVTARRRRHVAAEVKKEVFKRDRGQCTYVSPEGVRCTERNYLQVDHVQPYALGGRSEAENLRLLCAKHNRFSAGETFGHDYMARFS